MKKKAFSFPMQKSERILGIVYIPMHIFVVPILLGIIMALADLELTAAQQTLIIYGVGVLFVVCAMFRFLRQSFRDLVSAPIQALQSLVLGLCLYYLLVYVVNLIIFALSPELSNPNQDAITQQTEMSRNAMLVATVICAPILEELIFRAALFGTLRQKSRALAYIVSILVFALYHIWSYFLDGFSVTLLLNVLQYVPAAVALAWSYERSGTIWTSIVMHALNNLFVLGVQLKLS